MTAQTIENATGSVFATPARPALFGQWMTSLRNLSVQVELDPYLAADIGQRSYDVPVVPHGLVQALRDAWVDSQALAGEQGDAGEIERCVRGFDAPVLTASWAQAIRELGWLQRGRDLLSGLRAAFAASPLEVLDRHIARDIGIEFEIHCVNLLRPGGI